MIKVVHIFNFDPRRDNHAGVPIFLTELAKELQKRHVQVSIIGRTCGEAKRRKLHYEFYPILDGGKSSAALRFDLRLLFKGRDFVKNDAILHTHRVEYLLPYIFLKNTKFVTMHTNMRKAMRTRKGWVIYLLYSFVEALFFNHPSTFNIRRVFFVSKRIQEEYEQKYPKLRSIGVAIPFGCDQRIFRPLDRATVRKKWGITQREIVYLYVGRLVKEKQVDKLVKAFGQLSSNNHKLIIVGDGPEKDKLLELAAQNTAFLRPQGKQALAELYNCADCTCIISEYEGGPITLFESLACGTPVVTTDVGVSRDIIRNGVNGYIIHSYEDLVDRLRTITNLRRPRLRRVCRLSVKGYTPSNLANSYKNYYVKA